MNPYIGHDSQLYGVEEHRLVGGKGDGMRLLQVTNGKGLELTVLPDRCCDIARLKKGGVNLSYFSSCGYVAPAYYDDRGAGFLKSFTAGFLTTCGLHAVGSPCTDEGEDLPLHGTVANQPAEQVYWVEENGELVIHGIIKDEAVFGRKLRLHREIHVSLEENTFRIVDTVENTGAKDSPLMLLYHMNMGYPLLDEESVVNVSSDSVTPRNAHAATGLADWAKMEKPNPDYEEMCFYHHCKGEGVASIHQPKLNTTLSIRFDTNTLPCFTEWKMMGVREYVLGLEPGNCTPDGRDVMRQNGQLQTLPAGEKRTFAVTVEIQ